MAFRDGEYAERSLRRMMAGCSVISWYLARCLHRAGRGASRSMAASKVSLISAFGEEAGRHDHWSAPEP